MRSAGSHGGKKTRRFTAFWLESIRSRLAVQAPESNCLSVRAALIRASLLTALLCSANSIANAVIGAPAVTTLAARGTNGDAVLSGVVNPVGASTTAWFQWGGG